MTDLIAQNEDPRLRERLRQEWAVPPAETGSAREPGHPLAPVRTGARLCRPGSIDHLSRNAARAQSHLRRYFGLARGLTLDQIDAGVWDEAKAAILAWMGDELATLKASGWRCRKCSWK